METFRFFCNTKFVRKQPKLRFCRYLVIKNYRLRMGYIRCFLSSQFSFLILY